jgi:hypothetical protein
MPIDRTATYAPTVTGRIQRKHLHYGGSDYTAQHATASGKSLNYANGPTLQRPERMTVYAMPMIDKWEDAVGLFGTENKFVLYTYSDKEILAASCLEDVGYECAAYHPFKPETDEGWKGLKWDPKSWDEGPDYEEALWLAQNQIPDYSPRKTFVSVEIVNHKTGNIYNDDWLDVRLYAKDRIEHPYPKMYVPWKEPFYAGFHARNTRRLPYDVDIVIGKEIVPLSGIEDKRLIRRTIEYGTQV